MTDKMVRFAECSEDRPSEQSRPAWFSPLGFEVRLERFGTRVPLLVLRTPLPADLTLKGRSAMLVAARRRLMADEPWRVEWRIEHPSGEEFKGVVWMSGRDFSNAFDVNPEGRSPAGRLVCSDKFWRQSEYLNIPCPGMGREDDLNFSVYLTGEIRKAARLILGREQ